MTQDSLLPSPGNSSEYTRTLERRIIQLESQIQEFERQLSQQKSAIAVARHELPNTSLLSHSFLTRAFTVWGHMFVAQLLIAVPLYCLLFIISGLSR